jgi:hypothetical protein
MEGKGKKLQINGFVKLTDRKNRWLDENWKILGTFVRDMKSMDVDDEPMEYPIYRITIKETNIGIPTVIQININSEIKSGPILLPYVDIEVEHIMVATTSIHNTTLAVAVFYDMDTFKKHLLDIIEKVTTI